MLPGVGGTVGRIPRKHLELPCLQRWRGRLCREGAAMRCRLQHNLPNSCHWEG